MAHKAKKSFGQHFLHQPKIAERIASALIPALDSVSSILEVGPGKGILTQPLIAHMKPLYSIELDNHLIPHINATFGHFEHFELIHIDFLKFEPDSHNIAKPYALIGNFPYNISSQIIFWLIDHRDDCPIMVGMFQKELADRILSGPGSKTYGAISAILQRYYTGSRLFNLEPGAFTPPPKVRSTVLQLNRIDKNFEHNKTYASLVKQAFSQRRKKMRNTIGNLFPDDVVTSNDIFQERPEQLGVSDFEHLLNLYLEHK